MKHIKLFEQFINEEDNSFDINELPQSVKDYVKAEYPDDEIVKVELEEDELEVYLSNGLEIYFDLEGKPVEMEEEEPNEEEESEEEISESLDYTYKEDSGGGRSTFVLKLGPSAWERVKHLFDKEGRPTKELTRIPGANSVWNLHAQSYTIGGKEMHKIYGVGGDYTFGNAPTFYQQKHRGNKKAAKEVYDRFIKKYLS